MTRNSPVKTRRVPPMLFTLPGGASQQLKNRPTQADTDQDRLKVVCQTVEIRSLPLFPDSGRDAVNLTPLEDESDDLVNKNSCSRYRHDRLTKTRRLPKPRTETCRKTVCPLCTLIISLSENSPCPFPRNRSTSLAIQAPFQSWSKPASG